MNRLLASLNPKLSVSDTYSTYHCTIQMHGRIRSGWGSAAVKLTGCRCCVGAFSFCCSLCCCWRCNCFSCIRARAKRTSSSAPLIALAAIASTSGGRSGVWLLLLLLLMLTPVRYSAALGERPYGPASAVGLGSKGEAAEAATERKLFGCSSGCSRRCSVRCCLCSSCCCCSSH